MINFKEDVNPLYIPNIFQRVNAVMKDVKYVQKENKKVNGQYTFVSHDSVTAALHGPMSEHGIVMMPTINKLVQDGNRTVVTMDISFVNADQPDDRINLQYVGYGIDTQDKGIGKAISYAVKYALLKMFCLETGDDVEKDNIEHESIAKNPDEVKAQKKKLCDSVGGKPKYESVGKYFTMMSETYKKSVDEIVMSYVDINKFINDFSEWELANLPELQ
jgi:hypothetical protein